MRIGHVIGKVTLNESDPSYRGGRFLMVMPLDRRQLAGGPLTVTTKGTNGLVVYDNLGAGQGDVIAFSESGEAAAPFTKPTPVDAFNCAILDRINYTPLHVP